MTYLPYERVSLYGTALWDELSEEQRRELSKQELASVASTGLWFEIILIQMLARYAYHQDPQRPHTQYALTEVGDETRHVIMFAKALDRLGMPTYRPPWFVYHLARVYKATARGTTLFAPVLVAEEVTDRLAAGDDERRGDPSAGPHGQPDPCDRGSAPRPLRARGSRAADARDGPDRQADQQHPVGRRRVASSSPR